MYFMTPGWRSLSASAAPSRVAIASLRRRRLLAGFEEYAAVRERGSRRPQAIITWRLSSYLPPPLRIETLLDYLEWLKTHDPSKLINAYSERRFGGLQDEDPEYRELMSIAFLRRVADRPW